MWIWPILFFLFKIILLNILIFIIGDINFNLDYQIDHTTYLYWGISSLLFTLSIRSTNPISILLKILLTSMLFGIGLLDNNCEILTYTFIIVYLGALMLLFLFIVMILNIQHINKKGLNFNFLYAIAIESFFFCCSGYIMSYIILETNNDAEFYSIVYNNDVCCNDLALNMLFHKPMIFNFIFITIFLLFTLVSALATISAIKNIK